MIKQKKWHASAIDMRQDGYSSREIGEILGKGKTTINDFFKKHDSGQTFESLEWDNQVASTLELIESTKDLIASKLQLNGTYGATAQGPKILFIDIETSPIIAHVWRLFDQNVGLNQIETDWSILSFCAKWKGVDEIIYMDTRNQADCNDDSCLLDALWKLLNEADFVVGQNSKRFDVKKINARFILNGMPRPSTFRQIDTFEIAKRLFGFTSNKLEYMTDKLCVNYKKKKHSKFPGHELWAQCLKGNMEAWQEMQEYNEYDVLSLEELYDIFSSWDDKLPNFDTYVDGILDMTVWEEDGFHYTNFGKFQRYRNKETGQQRRSRTNLLSKEKRQQLLSNIV
ncbi:RNase H superfamily protein [Pseudomonas phage phiPMW]|uniref:RNase H superfamily protein n=1 Tax=Pseudomonas phage phiPMW TaxID=1815582 RepID=A0A1S5R1R7_9CAUD|nr:DNA polymerase exonuclease subunit [Pseudomonas phage phiPMW]ANA49351.1 RNase H superfamily protein [Pseudomonas phage phiPMW]